MGPAMGALLLLGTAPAVPRLGFVVAELVLRAAAFGAGFAPVGSRELEIEKLVVSTGL